PDFNPPYSSVHSGFHSVNYETATTENNYSAFCEAVMAEAVPFLRLSNNLYVVSGWDSKLGQRTNRWYHLQLDHSQGRPIPICFCPGGNNQRDCVHQRYISEELIEELIGPDCRALGIFNYNNTMLFSHDLLDDYTSCYTTSETPFSAWIKVLTRRYKTWVKPSGARDNSSLFVDEGVFRAVWFAYINLVDFSGDDMVCPHCGPTPETIIWDGVTLSFNRKQVKESIYPPTTRHQGSIIREGRYPKPSYFIEDVQIRKLLASISNVTFNDRAVNLILFVSFVSNTIKTVQTKLQILQDLPRMHQGIEEHCYGLHGLFRQYYTSIYLLEKDPPLSVQRFFLQISTNESCLQIVNRPALLVLEKFLKNPSEETLNLVSCVPCLYFLLLDEWNTCHNFSDAILQTVMWMKSRVHMALKTALTYPAPPLDYSIQDVDGGWKKSGCRYSMPQIRHRPQYPSFPHDISKEPKERGGLCNKYYSEYGHNKLTGGIMAAWCTHSICYGFHCIPESEGRNDVFSALVTRWPKAPKYIIYDFACQLAPYCMAREPDFFSDTSFLIDDFHTMGHTRCSTAFFLKTYALTQPALGRINPSAAECGNGGLSKIRKSVRYMGQERAILYTSTFLSI
ncbi:hypothetical protein AGABI1DRAFT_28964, partial [Agaricus bisporus var. burnettii JB137-S8]